MASSRKTQDLALVNPDNPQPKVTIGLLLSKFLLQGRARSDGEIFSYINQHFDWSNIGTVQDFINQAKWSYIDSALHATSTMIVETQDGSTKKRQVRKYLKPTEYDADGNAEKRWKMAVHCTEKQFKECGATYVKQTMDLAEATNAFNIHASQIVKRRRALQQSERAALPESQTKSKRSKIIPTPPNQSFFTEFMEVVTINPDTGERHLRVKAEEIKIDDIML